MTDFRADLHSHSTCSDGSLTPSQLVQLAVSIGLKGLSITDHDSIAAYPEALSAAQAADLTLVPGAEFSAMHHESSVHILAYAFPLENPVIGLLCERHHQRRQQRCHQILELLHLVGISLVEDEQLTAALAQGHSVGRPHIALAMVRQGIVTSVEAAFKQYLGEDCPCYVTVMPISVEETLSLIHEAQGLAVLAHPHLISSEKVLKDLVVMPFDGIEAYYARFPQERNQRWLQMAAEKGWFVTGGSDFHGDVKPRIPLGASWTPEETFHMLSNHVRRFS